MRKNSPRKWVHAILDLLPLVLIPIFALAVRSDNNFHPIEVEQENYEVVNFNQIQLNGDFENSNGWNTPNTNTLTIQNHVITISANDLSVPTGRYVNDGVLEYIQGHKYYFKFDCSFGKIDTSFCTFRLVSSPVYSVLHSLRINNDSWYTNSTIFECTSNVNAYPVYVFDNCSYISLKNAQIFDLTLMFGSGNEPTIEEFDSYFPNDYYDYTISKKMLLNVGTTTLSDTDVGSQLVYTLYNATDKYFNFRQVGNFNDIYNWLEINMFNGNAPLIVPVVFNIILYELIMDIIFLLYAVFMFIVDFAERMLDCLFDKSFGGGK